MFEWLKQELDAKNDPNQNSSATNFLIEQEGRLEPPEAYLLYLKLRKFAGKNGSLPLLLNGGFLDQPELTMKCLETCMTGEEKYFMYLKNSLEEKHGS